MAIVRLNLEWTLQFQALAGTLRYASLHQGVQIGAYELLGKQGFTFFKLTSDNLGIKTVYLVSFASSQNKDSAQMFSLSYFT